MIIKMVKAYFDFFSKSDFGNKTLLRVMEFSTSIKKFKIGLLMTRKKMLLSANTHIKKTYN